MLNRSIQPPICRPEHLNIQEPVHTVMPNGVQLNVLDAGDNEVMRLDVMMAGGLWGQSQPLQALFTNRMMREGTHRLSATEIAERLDYYGAWLELSNGLEYSYVTLYSLNKYLPQTLEVLESIIKEPTFPEKELNVVVENNLRQFLVNMSKVDFLAHRSLVKAVLGTRSMLSRVVEEEDYRRISSDVLRAYYNRYYHSRNCTIYLSGKVTKDCVDRVEQVFGSAPFGEGFVVPEKKVFVPESASGKRFFVEKEDALQSAVRMGMLTIDHKHPDYMKAKVLVTLLGGYFGSRLMSNIREEKGYTYGISAFTVAYPGCGMLVINAETANKTVEPLIEEVYHEIDRLQNERVPEEELTMVKNYMLGDMCRSYESAFSLADAWIYAQVGALDSGYYERMLQETQEVTPEEIRELAQKYLCKENLKEVVVGKKKS